mgnify:CR=1 FL=1|jgi:hypothetical protein
MFSPRCLCTMHVLCTLNRKAYSIIVSEKLAMSIFTAALLPYTAMYVMINEFGKRHALYTGLIPYGIRMDSSAHRAAEEIRE